MDTTAGTDGRVTSSGIASEGSPLVPNRNLTADELSKANELLSAIRDRLDTLAGRDPALLFACRRQIAKELTGDERGNRHTDGS